MNCPQKRCEPSCAFCLDANEPFLAAPLIFLFSYNARTGYQRSAKRECRQGLRIVRYHFLKRQGNGWAAGPLFLQKSCKKAVKLIISRLFMVDLIGIEPTTLRMRTVRSPSWAIGPLWWVLWKVEYTGKTPSQSYLLYYNRLFQKVKSFCHKIFDAGTVIQFCTSQTAQRWDKTGYRNMAGLLDSLNIPLLEERCTARKSRLAN